MRANLEMEEAFNRDKRAFAKSPEEWVGEENDPENPEYQKRRSTAFKVFEKATGVNLRD